MRIDASPCAVPYTARGRKTCGNSAVLADTIVEAHRRAGPRPWRDPLLLVRRSQPPAIEARHLTKGYGPFVAVSGLTFEIPSGQVVAVFGPPGAGKTTAVRLMTAFTAPSAGAAFICGFDVQEERLHAISRLGYVPESGQRYPDLTPMQLLRYCGEARNMDRGAFKRRLQDVIAQCGIGDVVERPVGTISKGLQRRVSLAQALLPDPDVLIMDEPMAGIEGVHTRAFREQLRTLRGHKAVLLTTTSLSELDAVVDRVLVLHLGRVMFDGTPAAMRENGAMDIPNYRMMREPGTVA
jgi:ABC-2 type transport system ATP-binding protein